MLELLMNRFSTKSLVLIICVLSGMVVSKGLSVYYGFDWLTVLSQ